MRNIFIYTLLAILFASACKKKKDVAIPDMGYAYFPLETGRYTIYRVDSFFYDDFYVPVKIDTFYFLVKEWTEAQLEDNAGKKSFRVVRSIKKTDTTDWAVMEAVLQQADKSRGERVENNQRYIKLSFPPAQNKKWDGNAYNPFPVQYYKYTRVHKPYELPGGLSFDSTLTVLLLDEENLIEKYFTEEVYAHGVGLIYKKNSALQTNVNGTIKSGFDVTYNLVSWGKD